PTMKLVRFKQCSISNGHYSVFSFIPNSSTKNTRKVEGSLKTSWVFEQLPTSPAMPKIPGSSRKTRPSRKSRPSEPENLPYCKCTYCRSYAHRRFLGVILRRFLARHS